MLQASTIFVVVDPTQDEHIALERAIIVSRLRSPRSVLKVFIGVDQEVTSMDADNPKLYRDSEWFQELRRPLEEEGLEFSMVASWANNWPQAILREAERSDATLIMVPDHSAEKQRSRLSDAMWHLLRNVSCPVLLVRPGARKQRQTILGAIKMQDTSDVYIRLSETIIESGKVLAAATGADFHVVNAYQDSMSYPDRGNLQRRVGLESDHIHVKQGSPVDVVAEVAEEIDADVVVLGVLPREGGLLAMRGNMSERIMVNLMERDVVLHN